ncbi:hypothetical protein L1887_59367 [Cichorium endivia]|nr:hypothetical protein L1887_59367 [Cichorium endivia]
MDFDRVDGFLQCLCWADLTGFSLLHVTDRARKRGVGIILTVYDTLTLPGTIHHSRTKHKISRDNPVQGSNMVNLTTRLKSLARLNSTRQQPSSSNPPSPSPTSTKTPAPAQASTNPPSPTSPTKKRHSISPKLRTFFEPLTPDSAPLGVLSSPSSAEPSPASPEPSPSYSGVAVLGDVEIVRRVSRGKVKRVDVVKSGAGKAGYRSTGTQTEGLGVGDGLVGRGPRRKSAVLAREGWEMLHTADAGLLFMASPGVGEGGDGQEEWKDVLPLTGNLLRKLQQAIAADAALQACQKRTAREIATLNTHQENLRKRKEVLKERLEQLNGQRVSDFDEEKVAVDKELVRVWRLPLRLWMSG